MGNDIFVSLGLSLALTLVLELCFCAAFGVRSVRGLLIVLLANLLTNPPVVLCFRLLTGGSGLPVWAAALPLEAAAVAVEWLCYKYWGGIKRPLALSLGANCFSYFTGLLLQIIIRGV